MTTAGPASAPIGTIGQSPRLVVGGAANVRAFEDVVRSEPPGGSLAGEVYLTSRGRVVNAIRDQTQAGVGTRLLVNGEIARGVGGRDLAAAGADVVAYGGENPALVEHAKAMAGTRQALVTSAVMSEISGNKLDVGFVFDSPVHIQAIRGLAVSGMTGNPTTMRTAAQAAAAVGVLTNDPIANVDFVDRAMHSLVTGATTNLQIVTKELNDPGFTQLLADAATQHGVKVSVLAREIGSADQALLDAAGIVPQRMSIPAKLHLDELLRNRMHFTAVFADDAVRGYVGTRYPWNAAAEGLTAARDMGVMLSGAKSVETAEAVTRMVSRTKGEVVGDWMKWAGSMLKDPGELWSYARQMAELLVTHGAK